MNKITKVLLAVLCFVGSIYVLNVYAGKATESVFRCADNDLACVERYAKSLKPVEFKKVERDKAGKVIEETVVRLNNIPGFTKNRSLNLYQVNVTIKKLTAIKNNPKNSILKTCITKCPSIRNDIARLQGTQALCVFSDTGTIQEKIKKILHNGLSPDDDAACKGSLIDELLSEQALQDAYHNYIHHHQSPSPLVRKPAIYLYPREDSKVAVSLAINGKIIKSAPEYRDGWKVSATKKGKINGKYDYLFYEATLNSITVPREGWVVEYDKLPSFFDKVLRELNFNTKETVQFKYYWLKNLEPSPYYEIGLVSRIFLDKNMKLSIFPKPDSIIRAIFYFKPLTAPETLKVPHIVSVKRNGFVVVEWGGILDNSAYSVY